MKIYISGKIGNLDMADVQAKFNAASLNLQAKGYETVNPLDIHEHEDALVKGPATWEQYMINDIAAIFACDAIYMLHDWQDSPGAKIEHSICHLMGKRIFYQATEIPAAPERGLMSGSATGVQLSKIVSDAASTATA